MNTGIRLQVVATGQLVTVVRWVPGVRTVVRGEDGEFDLAPDEHVRVIPPTWALEPPK